MWHGGRRQVGLSVEMRNTGGAFACSAPDARGDSAKHTCVSVCVCVCVCVGWLLAFLCTGKLEDAFSRDFAWEMFWFQCRCECECTLIRYKFM